MKVHETIKSALGSLGLNKARSFLTMLGVIIGVYAIVVLVSMVKGLQNFITDQFNALGSNLILVAPGQAGFGGDPSKMYSNNKLDSRHVEIIEREVGDNLVGVTPSIRAAKVIKYRTKEYYTSLSAGNYLMNDIVDVKMAKGRFFSKVEQDTKAHVLVIGPEVEKNLFAGRNPVGQRVKIDNATFAVIGVTQGKSPNFDDRVMTPYTTAKSVFGINNFTSINMKAKDATLVDITMKKVEYALLKDLKKDDFSVLSQKDVLSTVQSILDVLSIVLAAIAGISLIVGGIGIMNIMLVSVTERIKEIGLRKALGATSFNVGLQFLFEAVIISISGGLIGILLSWATTLAVKNYIDAEMPVWAVFLALGFSLMVGVIFGTYPAVSASRKDPIEALRYE